MTQVQSFQTAQVLRDETSHQFYTTLSRNIARHLPVKLRKMGGEFLAQMSRLNQ